MNDSPPGESFISLVGEISPNPLDQPRAGAGYAFLRNAVDWACGPQKLDYQPASGWKVLFPADDAVVALGPVHYTGPDLCK